MIKSFSQFLSEDAPKEVVFAFGRFNPPTSAHEALLEKVADLAKGGRTYRIYSSKVEDPKNNPLPLTEKVKFMRKMYPRHARSIVSDTDITSPLQVCTKLYEQGFRKVTLVVTESSAAEFKALLNGNNGHEGSHGFYFFKEGVSVVSSGLKDPDSTVLTESKVHAAISANDLELFTKSLPAGFAEARELFNAVRTGMGLRETKNFRKHVQLAPVSERREAYVAGELFQVGDDVVLKESSEVGKISHRGTNYLIVSMHDGRKVRKWLNGVELLEKKTPEVVELETKIVIERDPSIPGKPISKLRNLS